jgi:hypothetical protein
MRLKQFGNNPSTEYDVNFLNPIIPRKTLNFKFRFHGKNP